MSQNEVLNLVSKSYYSYNQILQEKDTKKLRDDLEVKLQSIKDQAWFENKIKVLETLNEELKWKNEQLERSHKQVFEGLEGKMCVLVAELKNTKQDL